MERLEKGDADIRVFDLAVYVDRECHDDGGEVAVDDLIVARPLQVFAEVFEPGCGMIFAKGAFSVPACGIGLYLAVVVVILFLQKLTMIVELQGAQLSIAMEELPAALFFMTGGPDACGGGTAVVEPADFDAAAVGIIDGGVHREAIAVPFLADAYDLPGFIGSGVGHHAIGIVRQA